MRIEELEKELETLTPRKKSFQVIKAKMKQMGHWKNRSRGNPKKGYENGIGKG